MSLNDGKRHWPALLQIAVLAGAGLHVLALATIEWWQRRDAITTVLVLWILGGFVFATLLNWTISSRSLLPIVPAVAILIARRLERIPASKENWLVAWPLISSLAISIALAFADLSFVNSARTAAHEICEKYSAAGRQLWFQGHWGFQYYMQELGARPVDFERSTLQAGDVLAVPVNGSNTTFPAAEAVETAHSREYEVSEWLNTMQLGISGFYTADCGPLPFAFGLTPPERYYVFKLAQPVYFGTTPAQSRNAARSNVAIVTNTSEFKIVTPLAEQALTADRNGNAAEAIRLYREALKIAPENTASLNNLAWLLASHPNGNLRDGREAVRLASRAAELTERKEPVVLGTLAAAYAETGQFKQAIETAEAARTLAAAAGRTDVVKSNDHLLKLYRAGKTVHDALSP
jgi:tetratricopeptide (TPR) repeat protein